MLQIYSADSLPPTRCGSRVGIRLLYATNTRSVIGAALVRAGSILLAQWRNQIMPRNPTPLTEMKKPQLKKLIDSLHSRYIIKTYGRKCVQCGSTSKVGCGHIFTRRYECTRWDIQEDGNCHPQCWPCNYRHVRDQYPYFQWYIRTFGLDKFDELRVRHQNREGVRNMGLPAMRGLVLWFREELEG